mgnify:CR=1 FL=1
MVRINGENIQADGIKLTEYLKESRYNPARIAIEINGSIIPKKDYESCVLHDCDTVEIVSLVGGG